MLPNFAHACHGGVYVTATIFIHSEAVLCQYILHAVHLSTPGQLEDLPLLVAQLVRNERTWAKVQEEFPEFTGQESMK